LESTGKSQHDTVDAGDHGDRPKGFFESITSGISSALSVVGDVMSIATFLAALSRPISDKPTMMMRRRDLDFNGLGVDTALACGPANSAAIGDTFDCFGTCEDEMGLLYMAKRWGYVQSNVWASASTAGTVIWTSSSAALLSGKTPLGHICAVFEHIRGSIELKVRVVASASHTGRLRLFWYSGTTVPALAEAENYPGVTIPIESEGEIDLTIPLGAIQLWPQATHNGFLPEIYFTIMVISPLGYSQTPTPSVNILSFVRAADDMQWANPIGHLLPSRANMMDVGQPTKSIMQPGLTLVKDAGLAMSYTINHIRELITIPHFIGTIPGGGILTISPDRFAPARPLFHGNSTTPGLGTPPFYYFMSMFNFWRGSIRLVFRMQVLNSNASGQNLTSSNINSELTICALPSIGNLSTSGPPYKNGNAGYFFYWPGQFLNPSSTSNVGNTGFQDEISKVFLSVAPDAEVRLPFGSSTTCLPTLTDATWEGLTNTLMYAIHCAPSPVDVYLCAADDVQFGSYTGRSLGPPPIANGTWTYNSAFTQLVTDKQGYGVYNAITPTTNLGMNNLYMVMGNLP